ncbi:MAG TPA: hypothetical protein VK020_00445 [Microlunatus sp.]|nr:hypothetical protein [Microlunatus sp.]
MITTVVGRQVIRLDRDQPLLVHGDDAPGKGLHPLGARPIECRGGPAVAAGLDPQVRAGPGFRRQLRGPRTWYAAAIRS